MARPGTTYYERETIQRSSPPTGTDPWFLVGISTKGSIWNDSQTPSENFDDFVTKTGARTTSGIAYDAAEAYYRVGGKRIYFSRVVGPGAAQAFKILLDGSAGQSLKAWIRDVGEYGNDYRIAVLAGDGAGTFKVQLTHVTDTSINDLSPDLADQDAAVAWASTNKHFYFTKLASALDPAPAAASPFASGTADLANVTDAHWKAAGLALHEDLGAGQLSFAGRTTAQAWADQLEVAALTGRKAILDGPDTSSLATLKSSSLSLRSNQYWKSGAMFGPWLPAPGVTLGTTRTIPPSAAVAGKIAHNETVGNGNGPLMANSPAAGSLNGTLDWFLDVNPIVGLTKTTQTELNEAGFNLIVRRNGEIKIFGWRSLGDPLTKIGKKWINFANVRCEMAIRTKALAIAERYVQLMIDGNGHVIASYGGDLLAMLNEDFFKKGALQPYPGAGSNDAMWVDVGPSVNTIDVIDSMTLKGKIGVKMASMAEEVVIEFTKVGLTEVVA